jgi:hypothetical protein
MYGAPGPNLGVRADLGVPISKSGSTANDGIGVKADVPAIIQTST